MVAAGSWTTHRELALLVGAKVRTVAAYLDGNPNLVHRDRVFTDTKVAEQTSLHHDRFVPAATLAELVDLEVDVFVERERRFRSLLLNEQMPQIARAALRLIDDWTNLGGHLVWGGGADTGCFLLAWDKDTSVHELWALVLYPKLGRVEVVFQYLARRSPFDDVGMRRELLQRLNAVPGIDLCLRAH